MNNVLTGEAIGATAFVRESDFLSRFRSSLGQQLIMGTKRIMARLAVGYNMLFDGQKKAIFDLSTAEADAIPVRTYFFVQWPHCLRGLSLLISCPAGLHLITSAKIGPLFCIRDILFFNYRSGRYLFRSCEALRKVYFAENEDGLCGDTRFLSGHGIYKSLHITIRKAG